MTRKKSKVWRKQLNQLRGMGDVPWPARRFRITPTSGPLVTDRRCSRILAWSRRRRRGWRGFIDLLLFRKPVFQPMICGSPLTLVPYDGRRRGRLECPRCTHGERRARRRRRPRLRRGTHA